MLLYILKPADISVEQTFDSNLFSLYHILLSYTCDPNVKVWLEAQNWVRNKIASATLIFSPHTLSLNLDSRFSKTLYTKKIIPKIKQK